MAHEFESGFFRKEPAWHGLGTVVEGTNSIAEALTLAGLDWQVELKELAYITPGSSVLHQAPQAKAVVRLTDGRCLGVVGNSYRPLQNIDAFKFFEPFVDLKLCEFESAGSLRNGQRIWVLGKVKRMEAEVGNGDPVEMYLLLSNSHDGSSAVRCQFTPIRVVCMNTLSQAEKRGDDNLDRALKVMHNTRLKKSIEVIQRAVCIEEKTFALTMDAYRTMVNKKLPIEGLAKYVVEVFGLEDGKRVSPTLTAVERAYYEAPGNQLATARGSYWGAYNAVTWWIDRERGNSKKTSAEQRLDSSWFGEGRAIRERAFQVALTQ